MTMESNLARESICTLLDSGETFETIAKYTGSRKSLVKSFYDGSGRDLDSKRCDKLTQMVMERACPTQ